MEDTELIIDTGVHFSTEEIPASPINDRRYLSDRKIIITRFNRRDSGVQFTPQRLEIQLFNYLLFNGLKLIQFTTYFYHFVAC